MPENQISGSSIGVLIFLIALFFVVYLLLIPAADRDELLNNGEITDKDGSTKKSLESGSILLSESPGILRNSLGEEIVHDFSSISIGIKSEPEVSTLATRFDISSQLFSSKSQDVVFSIKDLENLESASIFFVANQEKGDLIVELNEHKILSSQSSGLEQIVLPISYLQGENNLRFSSSRSFFTKTKYIISDLRLRESFEIINNQQTKSFVLSDLEDGDATLSYSIYCNTPGSNGRLRVFLNDEEISSEFLGCFNQNEDLEISSEKLDTGTNNLLFEIDKGDYVLNNLRLVIGSENEGVLRYKFSIPEKDMDIILTKDLDVLLKVEFGNSDEKKLDININNNEFSISTEDPSYNRLINSMIDEGNNFIEISPRNEVDIVDLTIKTE